MTTMQTRLETTPATTSAPAQPQSGNRGWSGFAIAGFVLALLGLYGVGSVLGIVFSAIGRKRARATGQRGDNLAVAGIVIGVVTLLGFIAMLATGHVYFTHGHHTSRV